VSAQVATINHQTVITNITVVAYVRVNHKHAVAANSRFIAKLIRTTVDGSTGPENITIANANLGYTVMVGQVLGRGANNHVGEKLIVPAYNNVVDNGYTVVQNTTRTNSYLRPYYTERPYGCIISYLGGGINTSKGVDFWHLV